MGIYSFDTRFPERIFDNARYLAYRLELPNRILTENNIKTFLQYGEHVKHRHRIETEELRIRLRIRDFAARHSLERFGDLHRYFAQRFGAVPIFAAP
jgi:hypothetical protein